MGIFGGKVITDEDTKLAKELKVVSKKNPDLAEKYIKILNESFLPRLASWKPAEAGRDAILEAIKETDLPPGVKKSFKTSLMEKIRAEAPIGDYNINEKLCLIKSLFSPKLRSSAITADFSEKMFVDLLGKHGEEGAIDILIHSFTALIIKNVLLRSDARVLVTGFATKYARDLKRLFESKINDPGLASELFKFLDPVNRKGKENLETALKQFEFTQENVDLKTAITELKSYLSADVLDKKEIREILIALKTNLTVNGVVNFNYTEVEDAVNLIMKRLARWEDTVGTRVSRDRYIEARKAFLDVEINRELKDSFSIPYIIRKAIESVRKKIGQDSAITATAEARMQKEMLDKGYLSADEASALLSQILKDFSESRKKKIKYGLIGAAVLVLGFLTYSTVFEDYYDKHTGWLGQKIRPVMDVLLRKEAREKYYKEKLSILNAAEKAYKEKSEAALSKEDALRIQTIKDQGFVPFSLFNAEEQAFLDTNQRVLIYLNMRADDKFKDVLQKNSKANISSEKSAVDAIKAELKLIMADPAQLASVSKVYSPKNLLMQKMEEIAEQKQRNEREAPYKKDQKQIRKVVPRRAEPPRKAKEM